MKVISINVSDKAYGQFKEFAEHRGRAVAEVIREAMDLYIDQKIQTVTRMKRMPTTSKPKLKRRWSREEIQGEMLG